MTRLLRCRVYGYLLIALLTACQSRKAGSDLAGAGKQAGKTSLPVVNTGAEFYSGATVLFSNGVVTSDGGHPVIRRGCCWSTRPDPTIADDTCIDGAGLGKFRSHPQHLLPHTVYYVSAYATTSQGTGYGRPVRMETIPEGHLTYTLVQAQDPTTEEQAAYRRIRKAMDSALFYYNHYTAIEKQFVVHYNPGVPTADGNFNGHIRFGANPAYSQTGTAMHEIAHALGVGQHRTWTELIRNGTYQGTAANSVLRYLSRDTTAVLQGDRQHFWPDGINGYWEDTGREDLYIRHAMILAGMKKDGLPSK